MFNFTALRAPLAVAAVLATAACGDDGSDSKVTEAQVLESYTAVVRASYADSLATAKTLKTAIDAFVAAPSPQTLQAAKQAWLSAREPYGQTEVYRFYDGPIDNPESGPEGQINAWPLDEVYIDYVEGMPNAGIVNDTAGFPAITKEVLIAANTQGAEENVSTGYHAIEFLLWGQDMNPGGPGLRLHTDYTTATNFARRGTYLKVAAELLVDDLQAVNDAWAAGAAYPTDFARDPQEGLRRILQGMGSLGGAELSGERMTVAYDNRDQEDEHSCFSDNTHRDLHNNALAIQNVWLGEFGTTDGIGLVNLVRGRDIALADKLTAQIAASITAIDAIPPPFDEAIQDDLKRPLVLAAIRALQDQTTTLVEVATLLGIEINLE